MAIKDLREMLKGIPGSAEIATGNLTGYSPKKFGNVLNIDMYCERIIRKEDTLPNKQIKEVIFWFEE